MDTVDKQVDRIKTNTTEAGSSRLILTLGMAGLLAGLIISGVNLYTRPLIAANKKQALTSAIYHVLPGSEQFTPLVWEENRLQIASGTAGEVVNVYAGYDASNQLIGLAMVLEEPGFQDVIRAIFGYQPDDQVIIGYEVLQSKETPGLGDKIIKNQDFRSSFMSLNTMPLVVGVKEGEKTKNNEVEMITGATISSKTIVRMLNQGLEQYREAMQVFANEKEPS